jgi:hypothetical protein
MSAAEGGRVAVARGGSAGTACCSGEAVTVGTDVEVGKAVGGTAVWVAVGSSKSGVGVGVGSSSQPARNAAAQSINITYVRILSLLILNRLEPSLSS